MPPPSPYNLNRWIVVGTIAMIVTGFLASRGKKPPFELEKDSPPPVTSVAIDAYTTDGDAAEQ